MASLRPGLVGLLGLVACAANAQVPDVRFKIDAALAYVSDRAGHSTWNAYSMLGRHSTASLTFYTEPGFRVFVAEKLQRFKNEVDDELLEEYFVEDEGIWRLGKQFLPFGTGAILRESVLAARGDTNLIIERFPISLAVCDGGPGAQRGIVGRIGTRIGASVAIGRHFGIASTALTGIRLPDESPGKDRGYRTAVGVDYTRKLAQTTIVLEGVALRRGETVADQDLTLADASVAWTLNRNQTVLVGWTRNLDSGANVYRVQGTIRLSQMFALEPLLRNRNNGWEGALELRVRF